MKLYMPMRESLASAAPSTEVGGKGFGGMSPRSEGAVNSTMSKEQSSGFQVRPISRRFMNAALNCRRGVWTGLVGELENPNAVKRSAGDQPCGRIQLEVSVE
jgi:hypothetical protein